MGSNQSNTANNNNDEKSFPRIDNVKSHLTENKVENVSQQPNDPPKKKTKTTGRRQGFDAVQYKCRKLKRNYEKCYSEWYGGGFLAAKSKSVEQDTDCSDLFDEYRECMLRGMKADREKRGLKTPVNKESMLGELDDDDQ